MPNNTTKQKIALSFDIEDWFTVRNMRDLISDSQWEQQEYRIDVGVNYILEKLDQHKTTATFFILGWIAEKSPELIKKIANSGHEIASHGHSHTPVDLLTPETFEADLIKSIQVLENITGQKVEGYRAPSFSVTHKTSWALDILKKNKIRYDSSIFVTVHPDYGIQDFPTELTLLHNGLLEVPMRKSQIFGTQIPVCGGGYFRMLPYSFIKAALKNSLKDGPTVMYFHPWEFDPEQPVVALKGMKKFRHYVGLLKNREKFERLLSDFEFTSIKELIENNESFGSYQFPNQLAHNNSITGAGLQSRLQ